MPFSLSLLCLHVCGSALYTITGQWHGQKCVFFNNNNNKINKKELSEPPCLSPHPSQPHAHPSQLVLRCNYCFLLIPHGAPPSPCKKFRSPVRPVSSQGQAQRMVMTAKSLSFFMSCLKARSVFLPKQAPYNVPSFFSPHSLCQPVHAHKDTYLP